MVAPLTKTQVRTLTHLHFTLYISSKNSKIFLKEHSECTSDENLNINFTKLFISSNYSKVFPEEYFGCISDENSSIHFIKYQVLILTDSHFTP